jgi:hypothetical protein
MEMMKKSFPFHNFATLRMKMLGLLMVLTLFSIVAQITNGHVDISQIDQSSSQVVPVPLASIDEVSLVVTMICRNEAVNFESNLALWLHVARYFVFIMDDRNTDNSEQVIKNILTQGTIKAKGYQIIKNKFIGFGQARTLSLQKAWEYYSKASHVMIADPDWRCNLNTMNLNELYMNNYEVYRFTIYDRNGYTTRNIDWLLRHREGLSMRYHLHEVLNIGYYSWGDINWTINEIEQKGTWHNDVGHSDSFDPKRYQFDLSLLYKDSQMYTHDAHVDYYLG